MRLTPDKQRVGQRCSKNSGDDYSEFHLRREANEKMLQASDIQYRHGNGGKQSREDYLQATQGAQRIFSSKTRNENNLHGVQHRAAHHQHVTMVEPGETLRRNSQEVKPGKRPGRPAPGPSTNLSSPKHRQEK